MFACCYLVKVQVYNRVIFPKHSLTRRQTEQLNCDSKCIDQPTLMCMLIKVFTFCRCIMQIHVAYHILTQSSVQRVYLIDMSDRCHMHCAAMNSIKQGHLGKHKVHMNYTLRVVSLCNAQTQRWVGFVPTFRTRSSHQSWTVDYKPFEIIWKHFYASQCM